MSPHAANSLVHDLVQMAQAMEELPKVQAALFAKDHETKELSNEIAMLNADLSQSRTYAASLEQKVHTLEVARDDAELAFLEADERTSRALDFVKALFGNAGALIQALEPPKAASQADSPSLSGPSGERDAGEHSLTGSLNSSGGLSEAIADAPVAAQLDSHPVSLIEPINEAAPLGQREPDPTLAPSMETGSTVTTGGATHSSDAASSSLTEMVSHSEPIVEEPAAQLGPYHGKNYYDHPVCVSYHDWIAGGGTDHDYYNRRTA